MNRHKHIYGLAMLAGLGAWNGTAMAAQAPDELVVTASRFAQQAEAVSADVTVIDRERIERAQAVNAADLLRALAGVTVARSGGPGKTTSVFLRGANSGHVVVLIDGVRVGSATLGYFDWANLSTADIERIEIVRGPQSSIYGADAMGGVIQIFTRKGGAPKATASAEAGSYGTTDATVSASGAKGGVNYAVTASAYRTQGVSAWAKGTEPDGYRRDAFSAHLGLPIGKGVLDVSARVDNGKTGLDGFNTDSLTYTQRDRQSVMQARLEYPLLAGWTSAVQAGRSLDESVGRDPAKAFHNADITTRIDQFTWENHLSWRGWQAMLGAEQRRFHAINQGSFDKRLSQTAAFASLAGGVGMLDVNGAVRADRNSDYP
ncbi:MAG: TonB-dependent receptor plug domain-containing protein, partial [Mariprofundaceae bacterium]